MWKVKSEGIGGDWKEVAGGGWGVVVIVVVGLNVSAGWIGGVV
ncbi:hypothetical protein [Paenibacillus xylanexedens]|nr:hypothetical protein [Paenibacillus xylanexedens]